METVEINEAKINTVMEELLVELLAHKITDIRQLRSENERLKETCILYEELRQATDGGSESMTHADAVQEVRDLGDKVHDLEQQLAAVTKERDGLAKHLDDFDRDFLRKRAEAAEARVRELEAGAEPVVYCSSEFVKGMHMTGWIERDKGRDPELNVPVYLAPPKPDLPMILKDGGEAWEVFLGDDNTECNEQGCQFYNNGLWTGKFRGTFNTNTWYRRRITLPATKVLAEGWLSDEFIGVGCVYEHESERHTIPVAIVERSVQQ